MMSILTALLVLVGIGQLFILIQQKRQNQLTYIEHYRKGWRESRKNWATVVFIGREEGEYYQVADKKLLTELTELTANANDYEPTIWALDSARTVCNTLSDVCIRILQGQLNIRDVYPLFGTEVLRHGRALRVLLDTEYNTNYYNPHVSDKHRLVRSEMQQWLIYHDGVRRRCLILIDLLWAEAARLQDLPPIELKAAADSKVATGRHQRNRVFSESIRLSGYLGLYTALKYYVHLMNSEYKKYRHFIGLDEQSLEERGKEWTERLLRR